MRIPFINTGILMKKLCIYPLRHSFKIAKRAKFTTFVPRIAFSIVSLQIFSPFRAGGNRIQMAGTTFLFLQNPNIQVIDFKFIFIVNSNSR